jgi:hypothetical protein
MTYVLYSVFSMAVVLNANSKLVNRHCGLELTHAVFDLSRFTQQ